MRRDPSNPMGRYILDGEDIIPIGGEMIVDGKLSPEWEAWAHFLESHEGRLVAQDWLDEDVMVSTMFLRLDHNFWGGPPMCFETMVFGPYGGGEMHRYATFSDAFAGHEATLKRVRAEYEKLSPADPSNSRGNTSRAEEPTRPSDPS